MTEMGNESRDKLFVPVCDLLVEKFKEDGQRAGERLREWASGRVLYGHAEVIERHLAVVDHWRVKLLREPPGSARHQRAHKKLNKHIDLLFDAFWQELPIGTGGRRGRVGYGANRINPATVAMSVQGHCNYLRETFGHDADLSVVVANDVRVFKDINRAYRFLGTDHPLLGVSSRSLARLACEIYAGNGIKAYFAEPGNPSAVLSTPELAFLIDRLHASGGINLSASHNPPDDNGVKVYDEFGSQPIAPQDQELVNAMVAAQGKEIPTIPFDEALKSGLIEEIQPEWHLEYVEGYVKLFGGIYKPDPAIPVVYTPLCGCGLSTVADVLGRLGFRIESPPDQGPDGSFKPIPFKAPNPEVPQATIPAARFADSVASGIVLSSDPDADRVGVEVKLKDGSWYHIDGNQIAAILCYYLMLDPRGPRRKGLVIETLVTTRILGKIVDKAGGSYLIDDLLVGFKYVADVLKQIGKPVPQRERYHEVPCGPWDLVLAAEESHGVLALPNIRDKDATPGCMYLAALYQQLLEQDRTLLDYYTQILEELGGYHDANRSIMMIGASGVKRRDDIMRSLRQQPPVSMAGRKVRNVVDYWDSERFGPIKSESDELSRNVIQITTDDFIVTIRPSGTEPKLKFYCQSFPEEGSGDRGIQLLERAMGRGEAIARKVYNELLDRIGLSLTEAALLLPDIVDLDRRINFERETIPNLRQGIAQGKWNRLSDVLTWLKTEAATMTPGADPLPALKRSIAALCREWADEFGSADIFKQLADWARDGRGSQNG